MDVPADKRLRERLFFFRVRISIFLIHGVGNIALLHVSAGECPASHGARVFTEESGKSIWRACQLHGVCRQFADAWPTNAGRQKGY